MNNETKQTITGALVGKIIGHVQNRKLPQLLKGFIELIIGVFLGAIFIAPNQILSTLNFVFTTHEFMLPKSVLVMSIFFFRKKFTRLFRRVRAARKNRITEIEEKLISGIPVSELADYLIRNSNFKREGINGVRETFGLNMEKYSRLAKDLEQKNILKRGENNMRILDGRWSRQALVDFLGQSKEKGENWFRVRRIGESGKIRLDRTEITVA